MKIYNSWYGNFRSWLYIETMFKKEMTDKDIYTAILKTMRYISTHIRYAFGEDKECLKSDLKEVREYFLTLINQQNAPTPN